MNKAEFIEVVDKTVKVLETNATLNPEAFVKGGEEFEPRVVEALDTALKHFDLEVSINYNPQSHRFPDIVLVSPTGKYGIEVKSSVAKGKSWRINGNSVMGSTSEPDLIETVIIFGKLVSGNCQFRAKKYEECIANVVVTHSPRYLIDMDTPMGHSFFDQAQIAYKTMVAAENPIDLITDYFKKAGQQAWWLSESTPAAIRFFRDLSSQQKESLKGYAFVHYPEIFSNDVNKYFRFTTWLATEHSIIDPSLRDIFSAGGKTTVTTDSETYHQVPRLFKKLQESSKVVRAELENADTDCLSTDWGVPVADLYQLRKETWISLASAQFAKQGHTDINVKKMLIDIMKI